MEEKQNATKPWEDLVLFEEGIEQKGRTLHRETRYMVSKLMNYAQRPPKVPKYGGYNTSKNATSDNSFIVEILYVHLGNIYTQLLYNILLYLLCWTCTSNSALKLWTSTQFSSIKWLKITF